ncbi:restriction endonuclease subunit S [Kribbella sp. NBC_01245]|uniref:restriction endonuclease subunit S n=1 Tax=Kribbella sp. NBC_01245 TaxID=2903578 RepID=UPI002E2C0750|nr:restriction endonuclease subunit S [Kribbella sp. NBC_01245]
MSSSRDAPTDWREFNLGELLSLSNGINADKSAYGHGVPFVNVLEVITHESLRVHDIPGRVNLPKKILSRYEVKRGDVLFNRTSETQDEVGLTSVYIDDEPIVFGGFVFRGRPITSEMDIEFSKYALRSAAVRQQIISRGQGGIRANIGQRDLKTVRVWLPEHREQGAIASALSDIDRLIRKLQRLIAKKQVIKQGMMQQLLTGRTRLPGFSEPWHDLNAGDIGVFKGGSGFPVRYQGAISGTFPFFKVSDMNRLGNELFMTTANNYISNAQQKSIGAVVIPEGAIVFAKVGAAVFLERKRILAQPSCIDNNMAAFMLDGAKANIRFVHYSLTNFPLGSLVATGALPSLNGRQLRSIPLRMPKDLDEQRAIAEVLDEADAEIASLRARAKKARAVKNGMMQELLTGRTRLSVQEKAAS